MELNEGKLAQISILNLRTGTNIYILHHHILIILRGHKCTARDYELKVNVLKHMREIKLWFIKRGYPENIADQELGKTKSSGSSRRTN